MYIYLDNVNYYNVNITSDYYFKLSNTCVHLKNMIIIELDSL